MSAERAATAASIDLGLEVNPVLLILFTGVGHDAGVLAFEFPSGGPGLREEHGVIERDGVVNVVGAGLFESFGEVELIAVFVALGIQPGSFIDADGIDNELIALPMSGGVSHPFGIIRDVLRVLCAV